MSELILTDQNFDTEVAAAKELFIIDLWAEWCVPCKVLLPMLEEIEAGSSGHIKVAKVNIDDFPAIAQKYEVKGIPTLLVFKSGELKEKITGAMPKKILEQKLSIHLA
jgi:thioredoxin 1